MTSRTSRVYSLALVAVLLAWPISRLAAGEVVAAAKAKEATLTLKITDKGGFTLEAKKTVPTDSNAFDAIRHTVSVTYRTDADVGPVITGLCGFTAPKGSAWVAYVDGKPCRQGIAKVILNSDTVIEWKIEKAEKTEKPEKPEAK